MREAAIITHTNQTFQEQLIIVNRAMTRNCRQNVLVTVFPIKMQISHA